MFAAPSPWFWTIESALIPRTATLADEVWCETLVKQCRASAKRPREGVVTFEHRLYNQRDKLVCKMERNALMLKRPASL